MNTQFSILCLCLLSLSLSLTASAQSNDEPYRGTWQIDTPDDGALLLMVKRNGRASFFWGDNADRSVYQGTWTSTEDAATLTWSNGSQHRIKRDSLGYGITFTDASGQEHYTEQARQVPKEILGQWAKAPTKPQDATTSDRDKAKGFFGIWKIGTGDTTHYVCIEPSRSAASTWSSTSADSRGLRGAWAKQGSELHIAWDSGHYSILRQNERGFAYKRVEPGLIIEADQSEFRAASRKSEESLPGSWLTDYQAEKETNSGNIAFSSRKNARLFYRGTWLIKRGTTFEQVELERFGGLNTSLDNSLNGDWLMTGQDIFMRWDNGMRKVLSPIGHGFVLYEYKPGRPLDGVPTRMFPAAPFDVLKLAEHLEGREDVAKLMLALAEAAGVDPATANAGWGNTFMRFAWPFGENGDSTSTDALLAQGYGLAGAQDPWWWPFWSEAAVLVTEPSAEIAPDTPVETTEVVEDEMPNAADPAAATTALDAAESGTAFNSETRTAGKAKRTSNNDWHWPFE